MQPLKELPPSNQAVKDKFLIQGAKVLNGTDQRQPTNKPEPAGRTCLDLAGPTRGPGPALIGGACWRANASVRYCLPGG